MKWKLLPLIAPLLVLGLIGCPTDSCDSVTSPDLSTDGGQQPECIPGTVKDANGVCQPDLDPEPEPDEPFNPGPYWAPNEWGDGFSAFALCAKEERLQRQIWRSALNRGYSWGRVLSETGMWTGYWEDHDARGRMIGDGASIDFKTCLRVAAESGGKILVVAVATSTRNGDRGNPKKRDDWVRQVARAGADYDNLKWQVANEFWHPKSGLRGKYDEVNRLARVIRGITGDTVSTDWNLGKAFPDMKFRYAYDFGRLRMDWADFHPWRNPDPSRQDILDILDQNPKPVVLSETTSYTDDPSDLPIFGWLVTTSRNQIQAYMNRCKEREGCVWLFHSINGLTMEERFSWMPQREIFSTTLEGFKSGQYSDGQMGSGPPLVDPNAQ